MLLLIRNNTLLFLKFPNTLTNQIQYLPISGTSLILCNVVQLIVQFRLCLNAQMLVVLIPHFSYDSCSFKSSSAVRTAAITKAENVQSFP